MGCRVGARVEDLHPVAAQIEDLARLDQVPGKVQGSALEGGARLGVGGGELVAHAGPVLRQGTTRGRMAHELCTRAVGDGVEADGPEGVVGVPVGEDDPANGLVGELPCRRAPPSTPSCRSTWVVTLVGEVERREHLGGDPQHLRRGKAGRRGGRRKTRGGSREAGAEPGPGAP